MQNFKHYKIDLVEIDKIKPYERNAKIHNSEQLQQIKNSILEFGFTSPLIIDSDFNLIAGHGRLEALKMINRVEFKDKPIKEVNAVIIDGLSETQKRALIIADNKITENAIWDDEILKSELVELDDLNFDLDLLGFDDLEFSDLQKEKKEISAKTANYTNIDDQELDKFIKSLNIADIKKGDLIQIKNHFIICGDSTQDDTFKALLKDKKINIVFTSPPYNSKQKFYNKVKDGREKSSLEYIEFLLQNLNCIARIVDSKHAIIYNISYNENARNEYGKAIFSEKNPFQVMDTAIYKKNSFFPIKANSIMARKCEFIFFLAKEKNNYLGFSKQNTINLYEINFLEKIQNPLNCACSPVELPEKVLSSVTSEKFLNVLDPFNGSGSTMIACEKLSLNYFGIELDPNLCKLTIRRFLDTFKTKEYYINGEKINA